MQGASCQYQYSKQPPSTTLSGCTPYAPVGTDSVFFFLLECTVVISSRDTPSYEIRWFRESKEGVVTDLGRSTHIATIANTTHSQQLSQYRELINQPYNAQWLGRYWCQPIVNPLAGTILPVLMRSNVFTLLAPGDYPSLQICAAVQTITNITCADQVKVKPIATTTVVHQSSTLLTAGLIIYKK